MQEQTRIDFIYIYIYDDDDEQMSTFAQTDSFNILFFSPKNQKSPMY